MIARLLAGVLAGAFAGGCVVGGPARWQTTLPGAAGGPPALPVTLDDRTGLVAAIGQPPVDGDIGFPEGVSNLAGKPDVLAVTWTTGACTERAHMVFDRVGNGYRLSVTVIDRPGPCDGIGYGRTIAVSLAAPLDARSVELVRE